jgi:hypothetical protein
MNPYTLKDALNEQSKITADLVEYIDLLYHLLGIDINYWDWKKMSPGEKISFARDLKIKKLLES